MAVLNEQEIMDAISKTKKMVSELNDNIKTLAENGVESIIEKMDITFIGISSKVYLLKMIFKKIL